MISATTRPEIPTPAISAGPSLPIQIMSMIGPTIMTVKDGPVEMIRAETKRICESGVMAGGNMVVGSTAQLTLMGAFYAQGTVSTCKQSNIAGTFVGTYFDMGTNVPSIFQVPILADNLPYGIIGAYPILAFTRVSWREIGL